MQRSTHAIFAGIDAAGEVAIVDMTITGNVAHRMGAIRRERDALVARGFNPAILIDGKPIGSAASTMVRRDQAV